METPPFWFVLISSSFFAFLTRAKAIKYQRNQRLWFFLGFLFGLPGLIAFYVTKKAPTLIPPQIPQDILELTPGPWYYAQNQTILGPISQLQLQKLFEEKTLATSTLVWHESLPDWVAIETFKKS